MDRDPEEDTMDWMVHQLVEHRDKRVLEKIKQDEALTELVRITEEFGGYDKELK